MFIEEVIVKCNMEDDSYLGIGVDTDYPEEVQVHVTEDGELSRMCLTKDNAVVVVDYLRKYFNI